MKEEIKRYKKENPENNYEYSSISKAVKVLGEYENNTSMTFNEKWYTTYGVFVRADKVFKVKQQKDGKIKILLNEKKYCTFKKTDYSLENGIITYKCDGNIKFEYFPHGTQNTDVFPSICFNGDGYSEEYLYSN